VNEGKAYMIYYDNAASTVHMGSDPQYPVYDFFSQANPSSPHMIGIESERTLNNTRKNFSKILNCPPDEVIFTSGGTESNNLAIIGFALANRRKDITFYAEPWAHPSVIEPMKYIQAQGLGKAIFTPLEKMHILPAAGEFIFISMSQVCHETGHINVYSDTAADIKKTFPNVCFHLDGAQGFCKHKTNLTNIDLYAFSAHKCHGGQGVGGLVVDKKTKISPLMFGGGQEKGLRPGTENVKGLYDFARIAEIMDGGMNKMAELVTSIYAIILSIKDELPDIYVNKRDESHGHSPYILNMSFMGINGETLVHALSERGVYASMGAACNSRKKIKPPLELMGFEHERAKSAVRFSFSFMNSEKEAYEAKAIIIDTVKALRQMTRRW